MANTITLSNQAGQSPSLPTMQFSFAFSIDTYAAAGVAIDALLDALPAWTALKLDKSSIVSGFININPDVEGVKSAADFDAVNRKIVLKNVAAGAIAERAAGAIAAVSGVLTVNLR